MTPSQVVDLADADDDDARVIYDELQSCFSRSNTWECEKMLGSGAYGAAVLVKERNADQGHARRVVLKRALGAGIDELKTEIAALQLLRGNAHLATMLASCDDLTEFTNRTTPTMGLRTIFATLRGLRGPAFVQEFCQNGTLDHLKQKAKARGIEIPNSLLWHFYLCLVRACIGFAYPLSGSEDVTPVLEILRDEAPGDLVHGDIAGRNIAIGDIDPTVPEHSSIPTLKMIDFGSSRRSDNAGKGPEENLHAVAIEMLRLICRGPVRTRVPRFATTFNGVETAATDILPVNGVPKFPNLDITLRDLLVQALRSDRDQRPTLADMLANTQNGVNRNSPDIFHLDIVILQQLIYDA
ncbi:kinase-like domain-containing protein [Xylaria digitata]|nr:kinase-like domain-containing protein [Xylaria digitata]